jgi:hypothetical protein
VNVDPTDKSARSSKMSSPSRRVAASSDTATLSPCISKMLQGTLPSTAAADSSAATVDLHCCRVEYRSLGFQPQHGASVAFRTPCVRSAAVNSSSAAKPARSNVARSSSSIMPATTTSLAWRIRKHFFDQPAASPSNLLWDVCTTTCNSVQTLNQFSNTLLPSIDTCFFARTLLPRRRFPWWIISSQFKSADHAAVSKITKRFWRSCLIARRCSWGLFEQRNTRSRFLIFLAIVRTRHQL